MVNAIPRMPLNWPQDNKGVKPTAELFEIVYFKGSIVQLMALWEHYTLKTLQEQHQDELIGFLLKITSFNELREITQFMKEHGTDMRKLVLDNGKHTLIATSNLIIFALFWLTFLNEEDKKLEAFKKYSLSWELLDKL